MVVPPTRVTTEAYTELYTLLKPDSFDEALSKATLLHNKGHALTRDILYQLLQLCTHKKNLSAARHIHNLVCNSHLDHIVCLSDYTVRLFAQCGSLPEAEDVFKKVHNPTIFTWNAIIAAHAKFGDGMHSLDLYDCMLRSGQRPDKVTFLSIIKACSSAGALVAGRLIHDQIILSEIDLDVVLGNTFVDMYVKCGSIDEAHNVFHMLPDRNVVTWDAIIGGCAQHGHGTLALQLFHEMQQEGVQPDRVTFLGVLRACSCGDSIQEGILIHNEIIKIGLESDVTVASTLIDMYSKCGSLKEARMVFDSMCCPNLVSWGCMISGYAKEGKGLAALEVFEIMEVKGIESDKYIYAAVLKACGLIRDLEKVRLIHERVVRARLESGAVVATMLVDVYAKCGSLNEAQKVFDNSSLRNPAAWGSIVSGYVEFGSSLSALEVFSKMHQEGIPPSNVTYLCIVKACSNTLDKRAGQLIYHGANENSFEQDILIGSALVDMFAKCGQVEEARHVFDKLQERNVVTWGAMLTGYAQQELALPTLELYEQLQSEEIEPNRVIFLSALKACCSIGTWGLGGIIHNHIVKNSLETDAALGNALVDVYARCGCLQEARIVFDNLVERDVISYSAMVTGYAECGDCKMAVDSLDSMCRQGLTPDVIIFTTALAACSRAGLVDEGYSLFNRMRADYGVVPDMEHFTCIIDLLGSGGRLKEAEALINTMHISPDLAIWRSLLTSSRTYKDVELASNCFEHAIRLEPDDSTTYTMMTSIYMDANRWDKVRDIQERRMCANARKKPGKACIDIRNKVYEFVVGEEGHATIDETSANKGKLSSRSIRGYGYVPQLELVDQTWKEGSVSTPGPCKHVLGQLVDCRLCVQNRSLSDSLLKKGGICGLSTSTRHSMNSCYITVACL